MSWFPCFTPDSLLVSHVVLRAQRRLLFLYVLGLILCFATAWDAASWNESTQCLDNAIPRANRSDITFLHVQSPLLIFRLSWRLSKIDSELARIVLEEAVGLNVEYSPVIGISSWTSVRAAAGCDPLLTKAASCFENGQAAHPTGHMVFDAWRSYIPFNYGSSIRLDDRALPILMDFTYQGSDGLCAKPGIYEQALATGIDLSYYRFYDVRFFDLTPFFATLVEVETLAQKAPIPCDLDSNLAGMYQGTNAEMYFNLTMDIAGVEDRISDGVLVAKCTGGWWFAPACRSNISKCIPTITVNSWLAHAVMQWATFFHMPLALGAYEEDADNERFQAVVAHASVLFYETLHDIKYSGLLEVPTQIAFPPSQPSETARGIFRTANTGAQIMKVAWPRLKETSRRAFHFFDTFDLTQQEVGSIGLETIRLGNERKATCAWLRNHRERWAGWVPAKDIVCQAGTSATAGDCVPCPPGSFAPEENSAMKCSRCPRGKYSNQTGATLCKQCDAGRFSNTSGQLMCAPCAPGYECGPAAEEMKLCEPGKFTPKSASAKCESCDIGKFANSSGSWQCRACPPGHTTQFPGASSSAQCMCPEGYFFKLNSDTCEVCFEGMICDIGSSLNFLPGMGTGGECPDSIVCTYPKVAPGYMSTADKPLRIYLCLAEKQCPGGDPGTCAEYRDARSVACGLCAKGSYDNGECEPCEGGVRGMLLVAVCACSVILLIVMTFVVNKDISMQSRATSLILVMAGQLCTTVQTMSLFLNIKIDWLGSVTNIFSMFSLLRFNFHFLGLGCLLQVNSFVIFLCSQLVVPVAVLLVALALVAKERAFKKETHFREEFTNTVGILMSMFFISVVVSAITPFICYRHPGDSGESLTTNPAVLCFESGEHTGMLMVGIASMSLLVLPFVALAGFGTVTYRSMTGNSTEENSRKLAMFRFLFFRFRGERYYYACISLIRNLSLCFVPVVIRENAGSQMIVLSLVLMGFCAVQLILQPWRIGIANVCDGVIVNGMVLLLMVAAVFNNFSITGDGSLEVLGVVLVGSTMAVSIIAIAWGIIYLVVPHPFYEWFICHHKAAAAAQARNIKFLLERASSLKRKVFIDSDDLFDLERLFDTVRSKVAHLLVYLTSEILTRPWCAGEIVAAHRDNETGVSMSLFKLFSGKKKPVDATCIKTLGFEFPGGMLLNNLEHYMDHTQMSLVAHNMTIDDVKQAYKWLTTTKTVKLSSAWLGRERLRNAINELLSRPPSSRSSTAIKWDDAVVVSTDPDDEEATSTASVLLHCMERDVPSITQRAPSMFVEAADANIYTYVEAISKCRAIIVILTHDSLQCPPQLEIIVTASRYSNEGRQHGIIPVHTPTFSFPCGAFCGNHVRRKQMSDQFHVFFSEADLTSAIKEFFNKIAISFATNSSERVLKAQSRDVFMRIPVNHVAAVKQIQKIPRTEEAVQEKNPSGVRSSGLNLIVL